MLTEANSLLSYTPYRGGSLNKILPASTMNHTSEITHENLPTSEGIMQIVLNDAGKNLKAIKEQHIMHPRKDPLISLIGIALLVIAIILISI